MKIRPWIGVTLMAALAACNASPQSVVQAPSVGGQPHVDMQGSLAADGIPADRQLYPGGNTFRLLAVEELPAVNVTVSSTTSGFPASRAIDGDLSTQWVDGGYRNATSWLAVELAATASLGSIDIKTGPSPSGTSYDVQVSSDGAAWTTVRSGLTNTTWGLESKALPAGTTGKFVRILWKNSTASPQPHFSIFEIVVNGESGGSPTPSATPTLAPTPTPTPTTTASPTLPPSNTATKVLPSGASASSTYSGLSPQRAIDGNLSTQWANGGYRDASAWLSMAFANTQTFSSIRVKTGALPAGVSYVAEVSNDGTNWALASASLTNTSWNMETKAISGSGKFLRLRFTNSNSNPIARFSVYDVEAFAQPSANQAPVIQSLTQSPMFIDEREDGTLICQATDADGDPLTYTWELTPDEYGSQFSRLIGEGSQVRFETDGYGPSTSDSSVRVTVRDGKGGEASQSMVVQVNYGSTFLVNANQAVEWNPDKAASAFFNGDVTVNASGDFAGYNAVICEYSTLNGRQLALLKPGSTTLPGVTGGVYMYLLGPTGTGNYHADNSQPGPLIPQPNIALSLSAGGDSTVRTITQSNIVGSNTVGYEIETDNHGPWYYAGENTAMNGNRPYTSLLHMMTTEEYDPDVVQFKLHIDYGLYGKGDYLPATYNGYHDIRVLLTDSMGGLSDNSGAWTIYVSQKYMGPF